MTILINIDCLNLILNELQKDKKSLYYCLLVNREWCCLVIPILWKKCSWCYDYEKSEKKLFNTILSCLPPSSKKLLFDNDIKLPSTILSNPLLFNYIGFCKFLEASVIDRIITMVFEEFNKWQYDKRNLLEQEIYKLFVSQCKNIKELLWSTSQSLSLFPGALTCFSQLQTLSINIYFVNSNALHEMSQICKNLNELTICNCFFKNLPGLISLIDSQKNLKSVLLKSVSVYPYVEKENSKELSDALARKGHTISNLYLGSVSVISPSFLKSLINLKNISIHNDDDNIREKNKEFQQYLAISEFARLQSLYVNGLSCFKELAMLIENTKGNILQVVIDPTNKSAENSGMLIKSISNNCPKIEQLSTYLEPKYFIHLKSLLQNCRNLVYIRLNRLNYFTNEDVGDKLLEILTKFSPKSLIDIAISGDWKYSIGAFERYFESCRGRTLIYFEIIYNEKDYITEDHKVIVRKYINEGIISESNCV